MTIDDPGGQGRGRAQNADHERAPTANDVEALDRLSPSEAYIRYDRENLYGDEAIKAFRAARCGGSFRERPKKRRIVTYAGLCVPRRTPPPGERARENGWQNEDLAPPPEGSLIVAAASASSTTCDDRSAQRRSRSAD